MNWADVNNLDLKDVVAAPAPVRAVLMLLIFLGIVAMGWYLIWSDAITQMESARNDEQTLREAYSSKKRQAYHYETYKRRLEEVEKSLTSLLRQLPNRAQIDALLTDINQVGVGRGLSFELFRPGTETHADFYAILPVDIRVTGAYLDIGGFVNDLAKLPRIVTLHDISLTPGKEGTILTMEARVHTYRYLDEGEVAAKKKSKEQKK